MTRTNKVDRHLRFLEEQIRHCENHLNRLLCWSERFGDHSDAINRVKQRIEEYKKMKFEHKKTLVASLR